MKYILILIYLSLPVTLCAQVFTGKVTNNNNQPLEYVTISLKADSIVTSYAVSNSNGDFEFDHPVINKHYTVTFSLIGYKTVDTSFVYTQGLIMNIILEQESKQLKEVAVTGHKIILERKLDRLVFNVENNVNTIGIDAMDLLGKTPMVRTDGDNIKIVGKESLAVMIDGRITHLSGPGLANMLRSIGANNISSIEVITNPPAQYDAEGNSGMINIVTKKRQAPGYFITVNERLTQDTYTTSSTGLNANYNFGKFLMFGALNANNGGNGPTGSEQRYYANQIWNMSYKAKEKAKNIFGNIGFEYLVSKSTSIGLSFNTFTSHPDLTGKYRTIIYHNPGPLIDSILNININDKKKFTGNTANFHISQRLDTLGRSLQFDADYFNTPFSMDNNTANFNTFSNGLPTSEIPNNVISGNHTGSSGYTFNMVFNVPFKKLSLTLGGKASFINSSSDINFYKSNTTQIDTTNSNQFRYRENIQAVFASMKTKFGKWQLQAGIRSEATQSNGYSTTLNQATPNSYVSLFPTFSLSYDINKDNTLAFNYGRRIGRPAFSLFNPFRIYLNQYDYSTGNPYLKPSFTNNFELSNTFHNILTTTLSYGVTQAGFLSVHLLENNSNINESTIGNFLVSKSLLLDNSINVSMTSWFETFDEVSVYYNSSQSASPLTQSHIAGWGGDIISNNTVYLNKAKTFTSGISFTYQFPYTSGISNQGRYYFIDLTASKMFLTKQLQISIVGRDILKTKNVSFYSEFNNIGLRSEGNNDSRRLIVNLKYSFGNVKLHKGQTHSSSGEEQGRAGH